VRGRPALALWISCFGEEEFVRGTNLTYFNLSKGKKGDKVQSKTGGEPDYPNTFRDEGKVLPLMI